MALRRPESDAALARRLREEGAPLGDVFSFLSGLYFRGKLEYARRFAEDQQIHVITMTEGLLTPDRRITSEDLERFARSDDMAECAQKLSVSARELRDALPPATHVILLGSIGSGKYTDVLLPIFGDRLMFPQEILHLGQLARGALFLRHAQEGRELVYRAVADVVRKGKRAALRTGVALSPDSGDATETPLPVPPPNTTDARAESR
jgi:hypothetical protein